MMDLVPVLLALWLYMTLAYALAMAKDNLGLVDVFWGGGFALMAILGLLKAPVVSARQGLISAMTLLWALRLAMHIGIRNFNKPEDFRYRAMRERWGKSMKRKAYVRVFLLQGALMLGVGTPILAVTGSKPGLDWVDGLGCLVWTVGLILEAAADAQLRRFIRTEKSPERPIMIQGLWARSRHPNYFGEALLWWGPALVAFHGTGRAWAFAGPVVLFLLLRFVSGVPLLEKRRENDPVYQAYAAHTPVFFPGLVASRPQGSERIR